MKALRTIVRAAHEFDVVTSISMKLYTTNYFNSSVLLAFSCAKMVGL